MALTVVLADDHQIVRQGLRELLRTMPEVRVLGEAGDGPETVRLVEQLRPHVLVLDLVMPGLGGLDVARQLGRRAPATRIVILSMHVQTAYVAEALHAGALGYVPKESSAEHLVRAIREAAAGRRYLAPPLTEAELRDFIRRTPRSDTDPLHTLTQREREVLQLTAEGLDRTQIAERMFISPRTVESHRTNVMRKINVRNIKELIRYAVQRGLPLLER